MNINERNFLGANNGGSSTYYSYFVEVEKDYYPDTTFRLSDGTAMINLSIDYTLDKKQFRNNVKTVRDLSKALNDYADAVEKAYPEAAKHLASINYV